MVNIGNSWDGILRDEFKKPYYLEIREILKKDYVNDKVYPPMGEIFSALKFTPYEEVKIVIIGQDPYHGYGQANGLAFSVKKGIKIPSSLQNIYKEIESDLGVTMPGHGDLSGWAKQGVLLLNSSLTVLEARANSHQNIGWKQLTDSIIEKLDKRQEPICFMLWGNNAKKKEELIKNSNHYILKSVHPSGLSAHKGFFGCKHFSKANEFLKENKMDIIDWTNI